MCREVEIRDIESAVADECQSAEVYRNDPPDGCFMVGHLPIVNLDQFDNLSSGVNGCEVHNRHGMENILPFVRQ